MSAPRKARRGTPAAPAVVYTDEEVERATELILLLAEIKARVRQENGGRIPWE